MPPYRACLVDVYDTVLSIDLVRYTAALAEHAGVDPEAFAAALRLWSDAAMDGSMSVEATFGEVLRACGADTGDGVVERLLTADRDLVREFAVLHDDAVPFLETLRDRGVRTAIVSNCADNTRPLLDGFALSPLVDELVLSCEVLAAKPDPRIFRIALERLGVAADEALFVDDQQLFCDAATRLGIRAFRIDRGSADGRDVVSSLSGLADYF